MNMYVGGIANEVTEEDLKQAFGQFGTVSSVSIITDKFTRQPRGFGFVEMPTKEEAHAAMAALNGKDIKGRAISVNEAKPKTAGGGSHGGGFGGGGRRGGGDRGSYGVSRGQGRGKWKGSGLVKYNLSFSRYRAHFSGSDFVMKKKEFFPGVAKATVGKIPLFLPKSAPPFGKISMGGRVKLRLCLLDQFPDQVVYGTISLTR